MGRSLVNPREHKDWLSPQGTPVLDKIKRNLEKGMLLKRANIETILSISYLQQPHDIVKVCCFGQTPSVHEMIINQNMSEIEKIFNEHMTDKGLRVTGTTYMVRTIA